MVRALFQFQAVKKTCYNPAVEILYFSATYDSRIEEHQRFYSSTPSGSFEMTCNNPEALKQFTLGKYYYFDVHEAPEFK